MLLCRISIFAIACFAQIPGNAAINIIDAGDRQPVVAASIFNNKGVLLGITDENGSFLSAKPSDFPLSVQCLGYEFNTVESDGSTIELLSRSYNLPEALVSDKSRDGLKILLYIRELSTFIADGDTTLVISENMADVILPTRPKIIGFKGHNKAQILNKRNFARYIKHDGTDSIARDIDTGAMSMISIISSIDTLSLVETPRLRTVASGFDTIMTKKNATIIYRKSQSSYTQSYDPLLGKENHKVSPSVLKLLGMTIDINEAFNNKSFYRNDSGKYRIQDMIQETYFAMKRGTKTLEDYNRIRHEALAKSKEYTDEIEALDKKLMHFNRDVERQNKFLRSLLKANTSRKLDKVLVNEIVDSIYLYEDERVVINLKIKGGEAYAV